MGSDARVERPSRPTRAAGRRRLHWLLYTILILIGAAAVFSISVLSCIPVKIPESGSRQGVVFYAAPFPLVEGVRVEPREGGPESIRRWATWTAFLLVLFFSLAFALTVSLFPRTWDEAYECHGHGKGCNLVDATWYQRVLSVAAGLSLVGGLAAIPLSYLVVRDLRRLRAMAPPVVDLSSTSVTPGERLDVLVTLSGEAAFEALTLAVRCLEEAKYNVGSGTNTETAVVYDTVLAERARDAGSGLVELARSWTVPDEAMHSFHSENNQIRWYLSLRVRSGRHLTAEDYDLEVRAGDPGRGEGVEVPS